MGRVAAVTIRRQQRAWKPGDAATEKEGSHTGLCHRGLPGQSCAVRLWPSFPLAWSFRAAGRAGPRAQAGPTCFPRPQLSFSYWSQNKIPESVHSWPQAPPFLWLGGLHSPKRSPPARWQLSEPLSSGDKEQSNQAWLHGGLVWSWQSSPALPPLPPLRENDTHGEQKARAGTWTPELTPRGLGLAHHTGS